PGGASPLFERDPDRGGGGQDRGGFAEHAPDAPRLDDAGGGRNRIGDRKTWRDSPARPGMRQLRYVRQLRAPGKSVQGGGEETGEWGIGSGEISGVKSATFPIPHSPLPNHMEKTEGKNLLRTVEGLRWDLWLAATAIGLTLFGVIMVYSAS